MAKKAPKGVNPDLDSFITELMKSAKDDAEMKLIDKLRIVDRALNLEKIKAKITDDDWGAGFQTPEDEDAPV
jgi:hypothetical protein